MNVTEYLSREYDHAQTLYKSLSAIETLNSAQKAAGLKLIEEQLAIIDGLEGETGTPLEERRLAFIVRVLAAARRLCLE